jgi:hypothetical protein
MTIILFRKRISKKIQDDAFIEWEWFMKEILWYTERRSGRIWK